ncbi:MAG: CoA transferase [Micromonosporaceae bacterium]|nr:CoA transferase [Micromonosporaceae bacterium]
MHTDFRRHERHPHAAGRARRTRSGGLVTEFVKTAALGSPRPLEGVTVLGLEQFIAGPCVTMWLADAGAHVIKVEPPSGDPARQLGPFAVRDGARFSGMFARFNRGKEIVRADLRTEAGVRTVLDLAEQADVVVENFKPGVLARRGLGYDAVRAVCEDVIYCSITGFGADPRAAGPYSDYPALDIVAQAMGGLMHLCGEEGGPPLYPGFGIGDVGTSMFATIAILQALYRRQRTGAGARLDVPMYDSMIALNERAMNALAYAGHVNTRGQADLAAPWGAFPTTDGHVALIVPTDAMWRKVCAVIQRPDLVSDERTATAAERVAHRDTLTHPVLAGWTSTRTAAEVVAALLAAGVPCGKVQNSADLVSCPQVAARGQLWAATGAAPEGAFVVGVPYRFVGEPEAPVPPVNA